MSTTSTVQSFWKLLSDSQLVKRDELGKLVELSAKLDTGDGLTQAKLAQWLVAKGVLSPYQAKILLAGRSGPFRYGDYQIYDRIESGRLAGIFRAIHLPTGHRVCLFFLSGAMIQDAAVLAQLNQQATLANRISVGHPHLFRCYYLADEGRFKFIVLDDLHGKRAERVLATQGAMAPAEACRIARQAALGLSRIHAMGQTHDELRPANLWLDKHLQVRLLMFPLSRDPLTQSRAWLKKALAAKTDEGKIPVEADYLAPELIDPNRAPDARSDIYSLGCTLYHLLTNQPPFPGGTLQQKLKRHRESEPIPVEKINPAVSPELSRFVGYLLAKDPDMRYQKADSVVEALIEFLPPGVAQTQPVPPTRQAQAFEAWRQKNVATSTAPSATPNAAHTTPPPAAAQASTASLTPAGGLVAAQVAAPSEPTVAAPWVPTAAPAMAMAVDGGAPMMAAPVMAMPVQPGGAIPMATAAAVPGGIPMASVAPAGMPFASAAPLQAMPVGAAPMMAVPVSAAPTQDPFAMASTAPAFDLGTPSDAAPSEGALAARASRRRKNSKGPLIAGGVLALLAAVVAGLHFSGVYDLSQLVASPNQSTTIAQNNAKATTAPVMVEPEPEPEPEKPVEVPKTEQIGAIDDPVWASPTAGKPIDLKYLALSQQAILALRPADLLDHPEGKQLLAPEMDAPIEQLSGQHPLGAWGHWLVDELPKITGVSLDKIEQLIIGWPESGGDSGAVALVVHLKSAAEPEQLLAAWGNPEAMEEAGQKYYMRDGRGYYLPADGGGKVIAIAPQDEIKEVIGGSAVLLLPDVEKLLQFSDSDREFTWVFPTRFFEAAGKGVFEGFGARLKAPVDWLLTGVGGESNAATNDPPKAILLSGQLTADAFFAEARWLNADATVDKTDPAKMFRDRASAIPRAVKMFNASLAKTPYSLKVLTDFDDRVKTAERACRFGTADKQVVARCYLPVSAALHMVVGTHLCLLENPLGASPLVAGPGKSSEPAAPAGIAGKLLKVTSLSFPRDTLQKSMQMLSDDLQFPIVIIGDPDLRLEGITQNQSFGIDLNNVPAVEIFKAIFKQANPAGQLIYVIKPDESGTETMYITTRAAAAKRGDKLTPEMAAGAPPAKK